MDGAKITDQNNNSKSNPDSNEDKKSKKMETCYLCNKKFDMNKKDASRYRYGKFPMCDYCSEFYGFYFDDPDKRKREKI